MDMVRAKNGQQTQSTRLYKKDGTEFMRSYDLNKGLMNRGDIQHDVNSQKKSDVLNKDYKKDYECTKTKYEFEKTLSDVSGKFILIFSLPYLLPSNRYDFFGKFLDATCYVFYLLPLTGF